MTSAGTEGRPAIAVAPYAVKLPIFEGPLDLLLHLIRLNEVDVADIPIAEIAGQYIAYLGMMQELDLDVAGEYLLMAATLAWIKSRMILPPSGEEEEEEGVDPRAELVARLLEYQRFKEVAEELGERTRLERDVFRARGPEREPTPEAERELEVGLVQLLDSFRSVLAREPMEGPGHHDVETEQITVHERMTAVMQLLDHLQTVEFQQIFELEGGNLPSRASLVATFLAILELTRLAAIRAYQGVNSSGVPEGPIRLRRCEGGAHWSERIAEVM